MVRRLYLLGLRVDHILEPLSVIQPFSVLMVVIAVAVVVSTDSSLRILRP